MEKKTLTQVVELQTAIDYLRMVAKKLSTAGEPALSMLASTLAGRADMIRFQSRLDGTKVAQ